MCDKLVKVLRNLSRIFHAIFAVNSHALIRILGIDSLRTDHERTAKPNHAFVVH